jgi:hypothetical protein
MPAKLMRAGSPGRPTANDGLRADSPSCLTLTLPESSAMSCTSASISCALLLASSVVTSSIGYWIFSR